MIAALLLLLLIVAAAGVVAVIRELHLERRERTARELLGLFVPAAARAQEDPRQLLVWYPAAGAARRLFPRAFADLDRAAGRRFPFSPEDLKAAHARVSAEWLAWERSHDFEYRLRAADAERAVQGPADEVGRGRLEAVEREKLERYQKRYEDYVRTSKALAALEGEPGL